MSRSHPAGGPPATTRPAGDDRRMAPRLGLDAAVTITGVGGRTPARAVNASERGLLAQAADVTWLAPDQEVRVRIDLDEGASEIPAEVVRVEVERRWVAVRFTGAAQRVRTTPRRRVRKSRAAPRPARESGQVRAELRSLSALVYEQALMDAGAAPVETLIDWADRLAGELGLGGVGRPADNRGLLHAMVRLSREADASGGDGAPPR